MRPIPFLPVLAACCATAPPPPTPIVDAHVHLNDERLQLARIARREVAGDAMRRLLREIR